MPSRLPRIVSPCLALATVLLPGCGEAEPDLAKLEASLPPIPEVAPSPAAVTAARDPRWNPFRTLVRREVEARRKLDETRRGFGGGDFTEEQLATLERLRGEFLAASESVQLWTMSNDLDDEGQRTVRAIIEEENGLGGGS